MTISIPARAQRALALAVPVALACAALGAGSASASTLVSCTGDESGTFSPALTNTLQTITYGLDESLTCTSAADPSITSGTVHLVTAVPLSSCASLPIGPRTRTITWNTGATTTITFVAVGTTGPGNAFNIARTGAVTSGRFLGGLTTGSLATTIDFGSCSGSGVADYEGPTELTISSLL